MPDKKKEISLQDIAADINDSDTTSASDVEGALGKYVSGNAKSYAVSQLIHETGNPELDSEVSRNNNNYSGITWNKNFPDEWKGTPRPESEGGNYVKFPTVDDWAKEHAKLLKKDKGAGAPADATSIEDYAHRLKVNGYYKDPESVYAKSLKRIQAQRGEKTIDDISADINDDSASDAAQPAPAPQPTPAPPVVQQTPQQITNSVFGTQLDGSPIAGATQVPAAKPVPTPAEAPQMSQQDILNQTLGTQVDGSPLAKAPVEQTPQEKTHNATMGLAQDYVNARINQPNSDQAEGQQAIKQITDPHADPHDTGNYVASRLKELDGAYQQQLFALKQKQMSGEPTFGEEQKLKADYDQQKAALQQNGGHVLALQHFNQDVQSKQLTPEQAAPKIASIQKDHEDAVGDIDNQLQAVQDKIKALGGHGIMKTSKDPELGPLLQQNKDLTEKKYDLNKKYQTDVATIQNSTKYNPIQLGAAYAASIGDKNAAQDLQALAEGKAIPQDRQYAYNKQGNDIMATGAENTVSPEVKSEVAPYLDPNGDKLFENNKGYIIGQMANQRYNDINLGGNPLTNAVGGFFPTHNWTNDEIETYGKQQGLSDDAIKDLQKDPKKLANAATYESQFAKGVLSPYSAMYERGARMLASMGGVPADMVNEDFGQGWDEKRGPGAWLTGNIPSAQNTFTNVPAVIGHIMEGAGNMAGIVSEVGAVTKGLQETGMAEDAATKLANFGVMSFNGYNDAYHNSLNVIGDKPEDETKRQAYSLVNGLLSGAIFSISPQSMIAKNALGANIGKIAESEPGKKLITQIAENGGIDFLATNEGKGIMANYVKEFAKENGTQVTLATAQKLTEDLTNRLSNPDYKQDIPDDLKNTAQQTFISMLAPTLLGAAGHVSANTPLNSAAAFDMGTRSDHYLDVIAKELQDGKISPEQAQAAHDGILTMKSIVKTTPTTNTDGQVLTPDQVKAYAYNRLQENVLQKKIKSLEEGSKTAGLEVDKAQLAPLQKKIGELEKQRTEIMTKPVPPPPVPQNEAARRKNLNIPTEEEKNNPKVANISEETIPLSPDNSLTPKTEQNEKSNGSEIGHGQESAAIGRNEIESQDQGNANGEGRDEAGRKDRQLTETPQAGQEESAQEQPVVKQSESASSVPEKKEKKKFNTHIVEEEPDAIPVVVNPDLQTQDLGAAKGKPEEHTAESVKEATIEHPDKPADVLLADHPKGESFNEAKDRFHTAVESIAKDAPDNSVVVTHSWGLKLLEAAHKVGWDHPNIAEEHQSASTEPGDLIPYKTEDGKTIWFARHGETEDNEKDLQRTNDTKLTDKGKEQAANIANELKKNGVTPSQIISSDLPRAKETADIISKEFPKEKPTEDATKINEQPQQESNQQGGEPEHARVEPKGEQAPEPEAKNSNSDQRSQAPQVKPKRKGRKGWSLSAQLKRRSDVLSNEPRSIEEHILHTMLAMDDKHPEDKWRYKDVERDLPKNSRNRDGASAETKRIAKQFTSVESNMGIDEWADGLQREIEDGHHPFGLNGMDSKDIGDMVKSMVSQFSSKTDLLEHLENLHKDVEPEELSDEEKEYNAAQRIKEATPDEIEALGKPKSELENQLHNDIADERISDDDIDVMDKYLSHLPVGSDGVTDFSHADPLSDEYQNMMQNLSHDGQVFLNRVLFESGAEDKDVPQIIKEKAQQNIEKNGQQAAERPESPSEGSAGNDPEKQGKDNATRAGDGQDGEGRNIGEREEKPAAEPVKRTPGLAKKRYDAHEKAVGELNDLRDERAEIDSHIETEYAKMRKDPAKIEELEAQLNAKDKEIADKVKEVARRKKELDIQMSHSVHAADVLARAAKMKKDSAGMLLSAPILNTKTLVAIMEHYAQVVDQVGSARIAIRRAMEWAKEKFKGEKGIDELTEKHVADYVKHSRRPLEAEPEIRSEANRGLLKEMLDHINDAGSKKERAERIDEVHDAIYELPHSDKTKALLSNYIEWHTGGDTETQEDERKESNNKTLNDKNWIDEHQLSHSGGITEYISHKTEKDIYGDEAVKSAQKDYEATKIFEDLSRTGHNLFNQAQKKYAPNGEPLSEWGGKFLADLNNADLRGKDAGAKKVVGMATMAGELQGESKRLEMEMATEKDVAKRNDLSNQKAKTDELLGKVQRSQTDLLHEASLTLNARRISRIFRNTHLYEIYEKAILSDKQRKAKDNINEALDTGKVDDKDIAPGIAPAAKPAKEALRDEAKSSEARKQKEDTEPKKKGIIKRIKEAATKGKKASKEEIRKNILSKEEKAALLNDILKEQKKTKC